MLGLPGSFSAPSTPSLNLERAAASCVRQVQQLVMVRGGAVHSGQ
jgi:hypothetical protein